MRSKNNLLYKIAFNFEEIKDLIFLKSRIGKEIQTLI